MIKCDVVDDNSITLMVDASIIFGDILPILYNFLLQIWHMSLCECDNFISTLMGIMVQWNKSRQMAGGKKRDKRPVRTGTLPPQNNKTPLLF